MGKKMKLPFLYRTTSDPNPSPSPWPFPSCGNIKTHSFRGTRNEFYRTVNPSYVNSTITATATDTPDSVFSSTSTPPSGSVSSMSENSSSGDNQIENVIRGLKSERLFFEPGESNSILESGAKTSSHSKSRASADGGVCNHAAPYKESVVLSMESKDPFVDFRKSMEEMVEAHGLIKNWEGLEELLGWYLRVNGKLNHSYIIGAFVDLLVSFSFDNFITNTTSSSSSSSLATSTATCSQSPLSPFSFPSSSLTTTPRLSSLGQGDDEDYDHNDHVLSSS